MEETVLLYNIDKTQAGKAIISILEKLNVKVIIVESCDLMNPIGYILGIEDFQRGSEALTTIPQDDMMVMAGFEEKQVDILLQIFREANIPFTHLKQLLLKQMLTGHSCNYYQNVKNEYIELTGMNKDKIN